MSSGRAAIFREILPFINSGDWIRVGDAIVFGKQAFDSYLDTGSGEESDIAASVRRLQDALKRRDGQTELLARTSLRQPPPDGVSKAAGELAIAVRDLLEDCSDEERATFQAWAQKEHVDPVVLDTADAIDNALAERMIEELERAHIRAVTLNALPLTAKSQDLPALWEEAHRCDLAGLKVATAALCRTVLEDSLKKIIDANGSIRRECTSGDSYISQMLSEAMKRGLIDDERRLTGELIKQAGNDAVHDPVRFKNPSKGGRKYSSKTSELVDGMRKILEDLHEFRDVP